MRHRVDGRTGGQGQASRAGTRLHGPQLRVVGGGALGENHDGTASLHDLARGNQRLAGVHRATNHGNVRKFAHDVAEHGGAEERVLRQEARQGAIDERGESHGDRVELGRVVGNNDVPTVPRQVFAAGNFDVGNELVHSACGVTEHLVERITVGGGFNLRQCLLSLLTAH